MAINLDEINTLTVKRIMPGIADDFFKNSPLLLYFKKNRYRVWTGGPLVQENFLYASMVGGAYAKGAQFDLTKKQTFTGLLFAPKFYEVNVTEYKEDVQVIIRGPEAILDRVQVDLGNAALTMSGMLAVALYQHGQNIAGNDRSLQINGLEEALTDGTNTTWSGATFPSYGQQARADVAPALNSPLGGVTSANVNGAITYKILSQAYESCIIGDQHPVIICTTNRAMGFINENFQPQQRIDTIDPTIGYEGLKFRGATLMRDQYCPGQDGVNDPVLGNYLASAGETMWFLNPGGEGDDALMRLYFAEDSQYQFGFTGFKVAQDSTVVAGQILAGLNFTDRAPRLGRVLFGITR